jgi:hypothetical protein
MYRRSRAFPELARRPITVVADRGVQVTEIPTRDFVAVAFRAPAVTPRGSA